MTFSKLRISTARHVTLLLLVASLLLLTSYTAIAERSIIILHTNDRHFNHQYDPHLVATVAQFRQKYDSVMLLDGGDITIREERWPSIRQITSKEIYSDLMTKMITAMNELRYDAMVLGNHDLGYCDTITRDLLRTTTFPILGANATIATANFIQPQPYIIRTFPNGITLAVLGVSSGSYGGARGVTLRNHTHTIKEYLNLRQECDAFVLLSHLGAETDKKVAEKFGSDLDLIIGGHSHTLLKTPIVTNSVMIAQAGDGYRKKQNLGIVSLTFDDSGKVTNKAGEVLTFDGENKPTSKFLVK